MLITDVRARWVLDSRGNPTVWCEVSTEKARAWAISPSGASTGKKEAVELRDGGKEFHGKGVSKAVEAINREVKKAIVGMDASSQKEIDETLIELDGSGNKSRLGGNATIAVSMAVLKVAAASEGKPFWKKVSELSGSEEEIPTPMFNIINGGEHAGNGLALQEFLLVPLMENIEENIRAASEIYAELKELLKKEFGRGAINVGDEGGFAPPLLQTREALERIVKAVEQAGYGGKVRISLDAAANSFFNGQEYEVDGKKLSPEELSEHYLRLASEFPLLSIEDPFQEEDAKSFKKLKEKAKFKVIGDDLTVTNASILERVAGSIDGLIIKPNQVGTVSETLETVKLGKQVAPFLIGSHRSGDSEDPVIADFSVGCGLPYVKFGAPARGERTCKYNRLLHIGDEIEK